MVLLVAPEGTGKKNERSKMRKREVTSWRPVTLAALTLKFPIVPLEIFKLYVNNDKQENVSI